ncbi:hypothetical protein [uncultured Chitinophaga sp.]|uniref:hypothetical protein n=1 Tax=uncultured Chitinophaga sp. TaxID=339340 RepID=UPI0025F46EE4|nr:hypothetical protein [uncultured Chitinophaga sp.]
MYLTESTMVPIKVTVLAWGLTGLVMTIVLRKAFMLYFPVVFLFFQLVFNTVVFGGLVIALLLSANYYLAPVATSVVTERIVSSGITKSRRGSARPFVKINYVGIEKRIKCDRGTNLKGYHKVKLTISKGFLGYDIIRHWELATE